MKAEPTVKQRQFGFVIEVLLELEKSCGESRLAEPLLEVDAKWEEMKQTDKKQCPVDEDKKDQ